MAITSSAKKAQRVSERRHVFNVRRKRAMKDGIKEVRTFITAKDAKGAAGALPELYQTLDKAVKLGTIKKNTAARMKSRITKRVSALSA